MLFFSDLNTNPNNLFKGIKVRVGGYDLYGKKQPLDKIIDYLKKIPVDAALAEITCLSTLFHNGLVEKNILSYYLDRYQLDKLDKWKKSRKKSAVVFSEQGLLVLLQLARIFANKGKSGWNLGQCRFQIGRMLLLVNDILAEVDSIPDCKTDVEDRIQYVKRWSPFFVRQLLYIDSDQIRYAIPRSRIVFSINRELVEKKFDVSQKMVDQIGVSLDSYYELILMVFTYWKGMRPERLDLNRVSMNGDTVFEKTGNSNHFQESLKHISQQYDDIHCDSIPDQNDIDGWRSFVYQMYDLRKKPLLSSEGRIYCGSLRFLEELIWQSPYYLMLDILEKDDKNLFFQYMGESFERYVYRLSKDAFGESCSQYCLQNGNPLNDFVVDLSNDWKIIVEAKACRPTSSMTSGNTPLLEMKEFDSKIKYGISQLSDRISELRAEGFRGRVSPVLLSMGPIPVNGHIWEMINSGIMKTGFYSDQQCDWLIIADPVGWEVFCAEVKSGNNAESILELRLSRTDLKYGSFKDFLYREVCQGKLEAENSSLLSLYEDVFDEILSSSFNGGLSDRRYEMGLWKSVFL